MFPILLKIGPVTIYTFSFLLTIGFFLFSFLSWRRLRNLGLDEEKVVDLLLTMTLFGFLAARIGFILTHWPLFGFLPARWFLLGRFPGLSFWGTVIGGSLALSWFCRRQRWDFWRVADEVAFSFLPLGVLFYLGCFFNGCFLGVATNNPWGMFFPGDLIRRQPVALFYGLGFFLIWVILLLVERRWRTWKWYQASAEGFVSLLFLLLAFLITFWLAFVQEDQLYYLWLKRGLSFLGFLVVLGIFYKRSGIKIKSNLPKRLPLKNGQKEKKKN